MLIPQLQHLLARSCKWEPTPGRTWTTPLLALPYQLAKPSQQEAKGDGLFLRSAQASENSGEPKPQMSGLWKGALLVDAEEKVLTRLPDWQPAPLEDRTPAISDEIVVFEGAHLLLERPRQLVDLVIRLRQTAGPGRILYAPQCPPEAWPLLVYLGVDLFDGLEPYMASTGGQLIQWTGRYQGELGNTIEANLTHSLERMDELRRNLREGRFREFVEASCLPHPEMVAALRLADTEHYQAFASQVPRVNGKNLGREIRPTSDLAFNRPEVRYWRQRLREYRPPPQAPVLVLFPCSARKPYQYSRSHRRFREALSGFRHRWRIHEVSLTSPLGLVPRELERCFPAAHYDLPVTGHWSGDEREMARQQLRHLLRHGEYQTVISHLGDQHALLADLLPTDTITAGNEDHVTSEKALKNLRREAAKAVQALPGITPQERLKYDVFALASFQFGAEVAAQLTHACQVKGRVERPRILDREGKQLAMVDPERGFLSLTLDGAKRLLEAGGPWLQLENFELRGDIFAGGIEAVGGSFQPGDEVVLVQKGELAGVGVALFGSHLMVRLQRGLAVKVRHRAPGGGDQGE